MNPITSLMDKFRAWRYEQTGISGLNELQNNIRMILVIVTPFLAVWFSIQYIIIAELVPEWLGAWMLLGTIFGWLGYCGVYWFWVGKDASRFKVLPQTTCFFPDGGDRKFNFVIKQGGIKERCDFTDGSKGLELDLLHRYLYQAKDMDFPYVFDKVLIKIPASFGESFKFVSVGEFWHKNLIVETGNCEYVSYYVFEWIKENGEWKPLGTVADCSLNYERALQKYLDPAELVDMVEADAFYLAWKGQVKKFEELQRYTARLEDAHEVALKMGGRDLKKEVDKVLESIREGVHDIDDVTESRFRKIFKFWNIIKVLIVIAVIYGIAHYLLGVV